jgi:hypothetical protein
MGRHGRMRCGGGSRDCAKEKMRKEVDMNEQKRG